MGMSAADADDAPFRDIPAKRIPYRLTEPTTEPGERTARIHSTRDVLISLQRELDAFLAERDSQ